MVIEMMYVLATLFGVATPIVCILVIREAVKEALENEYNPLHSVRNMQQDINSDLR